MTVSITGNIQKLKALLADPIQYYLPIDKQELPLNSYLGKTITLTILGINCIYCNRIIKKSYQQGYCFPCVQKLARCDFCILDPVKCHYHLGTCREPEWGLTHCFIPHIVYLANTSGFKVGITREVQMQTRWIDQGAVQALPLFRVSNRYHSGIVEDTLRTLITDKTDWRKMLSQQGEDLDLLDKRLTLWNAISQSNIMRENLEFLTEAQVLKIRYPVLTYPSKVKAVSVENHSKIQGTLLGIKGQYFILDIGVINIRHLNGYRVEFSS